MVEDVDCSKDVKKEVTNLKPWLKDCASRSLTETGKSQKSLLVIAKPKKTINLVALLYLEFWQNPGKNYGNQQILCTYKASF